MPIRIPFAPKGIRTASSMNRDFGAPRAVRVSFIVGIALPIEDVAALLPSKNFRSESDSFSAVNSCPLDESQFEESHSRYKLELLTPIKVVNAVMPTIQALSPKSIKCLNSQPIHSSALATLAALGRSNSRDQQPA